MDTAGSLCNYINMCLVRWLLSETLSGTIVAAEAILDAYVFTTEVEQAYVCSYAHIYGGIDRAA